MFIHRYESFDAMVRFFAYFVPPNEAEALPATALPPSPHQSSSPASAEPSSPTKLDSLHHLLASAATRPADSQNEQEAPVNMPKELRNRMPKQAAGSGNRVQKSTKDGPRRSMRLRMRSKCSPAGSVGAPGGAMASGAREPRRRTAVPKTSGRRTGEK